MIKKEIIWRELLFQAIEKKKFNNTQKDLAKKFGFSLSTVFSALKIPRQVGAVNVGGKGIQIRDIEKFIVLWATMRNLSKEVIYKTNTGLDTLQTEKSMPNNIIWTAYSAFRLKYPKKPLPASYDKIYVYANKTIIKQIQKRFPKNKKEPNLFILKPDPYLKNYGKIAPLPQILADLWNIKDWYASDFYKILLEKIKN